MLTLVDGGATLLGGFNTYTAQLALCLEQQGHPVRIWRPGARTEHRARPYVESMTCRLVDASTVRRYAHNHAPLIITAGSSTLARDSDWLKLLRLGVPLAIHDPNDLKALAPVLRRGHPVVCGRRAMAGLARELGLSSIHIPYPYAPVGRRPMMPTDWMSCWARLDWDKHTEVLVEANRQLDAAHRPPSQRITLYGAENRLYTHHRLDSLAPDWRIHYRGAFPRERAAGVRVASRASWAIDLSAIPGEGGGSQYTFKEAWDAGTPLIVSQDWLLPGDELVDGVNCLGVPPSPPAVLALLERLRAADEASSERAALVAGGRATLLAHAPAAVVPPYLDFLGVS